MFQFRLRHQLTLVATFVLLLSLIIPLAAQAYSNTRAGQSSHNGSPNVSPTPSSSPSVKPSPGSRHPLTSATITVVGTQPWTDTGIDLASGNLVTIKASGTIYFAAGPALPYGPNGNTSCTAGSGFTAPGLHCFSLVANIANGTPFQAGSNTSFSATSSGRLYLGVNDNVFTDNSGSWTASVTVTTAVSSITITSTSGWQQTGLTVQQGAQFVISYISGTWTVDVNNWPYVDPNGYPPDIDKQIYQGCKYDSSYVYAKLLGQIGSGSDFAVGTGGTFTASASGTLSLRINDADACLGDNGGSIVLTATQYIEVASGNWGGYSVAFTNPQNTPLSVSGAWTVPSITCINNSKPISGQVAVWDGLGGAQSGNSLEQIGTDSQCIKGVATYWAWYEFPPAAPYKIKKDGNYLISPGDTIRADVTDQGSGYFVLRIFDDTKGWYYTKIWINQNASATPQTGEWIVEDPGNGTFPQFYNVVLTNCFWVQNSPQEKLSTGTNITRYTIYQINFPNKRKETTLDIFPDGTDFSVYWNHS